MNLFLLQVESVYINDDFYGPTGFYANDIAIVVLPIKVKISYMVSPVCLDWTKKYTVPNGSLGKVIF